MSFLIVAVVLIAWVFIAPGCFTFRMSDQTARLLFARKGLHINSHFLKVEGRDLHYMMVGNDQLPTLVFIHGSPSAWNAFIDYMDDPGLLLHFRMVSIDRPGFGYSNFGDAMTMEDQARQILPVFKEINNGQPVFLAGHSLGGPLLIKLAAEAPGSFAGIMLIAGSVDPELEPAEGWRYLMESFPLRHFMPGAFKPSNTELLFFKKDVVKLADDFPKVKCPVYLVHGDKDSWVPPGNVTYAAKKLVNALKVETLMLPGGNHFIPWTRKKEIMEEMIKMLSQTAHRSAL